MFKLISKQTPSTACLSLFLSNNKGLYTDSKRIAGCYDDVWDRIGPKFTSQFRIKLVPIQRWWARDLYNRKAYDLEEETGKTISKNNRLIQVKHSKERVL